MFKVRANRYMRVISVRERLYNDFKLSIRGFGRVSNKVFALL